MPRYILGRLLQGIGVLFLVSIVVFVLARLTGNPAVLLAGGDADAEDIAILTAHLGLDKPLPEQYWIFISNAVQGNFGDSLRYNAPVMNFIAESAPATIGLTALSMVFSIIISVPAGVIGAVMRERWPDSIGKIIAILGQSMPAFWLGIVLIEVFAVRYHWLPAGGMGDFKSWILPAFTLGYHSTAGALRFTRSAMIDVLDTDYVRLAKIKGLSGRVVIWKHALRNALIPVITFYSMIFARKLMGTVVVETVFSWPGLGRLAYQSVMYRDFPMMQGLILTFVAIFVVVNLLTDLAYCYLDPRIRYVKE